MIFYETYLEGRIAMCECFYKLVTLFLLLLLCDLSYVPDVKNNISATVTTKRL